MPKTKILHHNATHGKSNTRLYKIYHAMKGRCENPNKDRYWQYGGRGIKVCKSWSNSFLVFAKWAEENGYTDNLEIDRIDNNKGYSPSNCRWVTPKQNTRNRSNNRLVTAFGETKCLSEWIEDSRCKAGWTTVKARLNSGWNVEDAITKLPRYKNLH